MPERMTAEEFASRAKKNYGDRFDYSEVEYVNNNVKVKIHCNVCGNDFWQVPRNHLSGVAGCKVCANKSKSLTQEEFISKAKEIHGDKYDYGLVEYKNNRTNVRIICPVHGEFLQTPSVHLTGAGCKKCFLDSRRKTQEDFVAQAKEIHGDKYDYSESVYISNHSKLLIHCNQCGRDFWQAPNAHLAGKGCAKCAGIIKKSVDEFVQQARVVHGDKYDYSQVEYINTDTPVKIICPVHGEFWQAPKKHLKGQSCPNCKKSHGEERVLKFLKEHNLNFIYNSSCLDFLKPLKPDFYLPDKKLVIEYDGEQHFRPVQFAGMPIEKAESEFEKTKRRDSDKNRLCEEHGIEVFRIPYTEFENIETILEEKLL